MEPGAVLSLHSPPVLEGPSKPNFHQFACTDLISKSLLSAGLDSGGLGGSFTLHGSRRGEVILLHQSQSQHPEQWFLSLQGLQTWPGTSGWARAKGGDGLLSCWSSAAVTQPAGSRQQCQHPMFGCGCRCFCLKESGWLGLLFWE